MKKLLLCLMIGLFSAFLLWLYRFLFQRQLAKISRSLIRRDFDKALKQLETPSAHFFLKPLRRKMLKLEALLLKKDTAAIEAMFTELEKALKSSARKIMLYQKEIAYYLENKRTMKAIQAYENLRENAENISSPMLEEIIEDCDIMIHVYGRKDDWLIDKILAKIEKASNEGLQKGVYCYRAAVSYYHAEDEENCRRYLEKCRDCFKDTIFEKMVDPILTTDLSLIEQKIM